MENIHSKLVLLLYLQYNKKNGKDGIAGFGWRAYNTQ
jgi:hypothetical protein